MPKLELSAPWVIYANKVAALFDGDQEVEVEYDNDAREVTIRVANATKADAISKLFPEEVEFGNVKLYIEVVPANEDQSNAALFRRAFAGNLNVADVVTVDGVLVNDPTYVVFEPEVVQFYSDNGGDINGLTSTLYETIAKELWADRFPNILFCTDKTDYTMLMDAAN